MCCVKQKLRMGTRAFENCDPAPEEEDTDSDGALWLELFAINSKTVRIPCVAVSRAARLC